MSTNSQKQINQLTDGIANFLINSIEKENFFQSRYGAAFSLAFLEMKTALTPTCKKRLSDLFFSMNQDCSEFHWQFNQYALLHYQMTSKSKTFASFLKKNRFNKTTATNWLLLKCNFQIRMGCNNDTGSTQEILLERQCKNGLIMDSPNDRSFQYHCFSLALVGEIYQLTKDPFILKSFKKGIDFISHFILRNGDTLYIGRGQQQLFGYAALVYCLTLEQSITKTDSRQLDPILSFMVSYVQSDGSLPLVFNGQNTKNNSNPDLMDEQYLGWYSYNNFFDYLPFAGFFLNKAYRELKKNQTIKKTIYAPRKKYSDKTFFSIRKKKYDACFTATGGCWTNDLPIPYIVYQNHNITPCYGGEQFCTSLYREEGIPVPFFYPFHVSIRKKSISRIWKNRLWIVSPFGLMIRHFQFEENEIIIKSRVLSFFPCIQHFLTFENVKQANFQTLSGTNFQFISNTPLTFKEKFCCAQGRLDLYTTRSKNWTLKVKFNEN